MISASKEDPFSQAGNYSLGWIYFCVILVAASLVIRLYHMWTDKIRRALYKEALAKNSPESASECDYEMANFTNNSVSGLFPRDLPNAAQADTDSTLSIPLVNRTIAFARWICYRPTPIFRCNMFGRKRIITFPNASVVSVVAFAFAFVMLYTFIPQPYFYQSIAFGSPPLAIRAGMLSVAMIPWIIALSMKANLVSLVTGIGHERLGVYHRWAGYICLALAIVHTVPFYVTPVWDEGYQGFLHYFRGPFYIYGTGVAALAPLGFLCIHSLPVLRRLAYELFVMLHIPAAAIFVAMMFWHCNNALTSWAYLEATVAIWGLSLIYRLYYLNWSRWWRGSFLCGEDAAVTMMSENAVKVTIPTQMRWSPGQFVYLRIPGISVFENHPFTIASLCSDDFPSTYGEQYRDMTLVFRPFGGFTRKVAAAAMRHGPNHTYRAFVDGPYGGMQRELASFDSIVLIAGGSGITALVSQLLLLIKKMRDGSAVTKQVHVIWALKRPETADWFREELRICRQFAPPESVHCQFFITAAKRRVASANDAPLGLGLDPKIETANMHDRLDAAFHGIASKRNSAVIREDAAGDLVLEKELERETEDAITALPRAHLVPSRHAPVKMQGFEKNSLTLPKAQTPNPQHSSTVKMGFDDRIVSPSQSRIPSSGQMPAYRSEYDNPPEYRHYARPPVFPPPPTSGTASGRRNKPSMKVAIPTAALTPQGPAAFDFGFPNTPTVLQKSLVRFAFGPGAASAPLGGKKGWHTEYGRPDLGYMLRQMEPGWGRRTAVFVCGPQSMRKDVKATVAQMQRGVMRGSAAKDEIFLWGEEYAL